MGICYYNGNGVAQNDAMAIKLFSEVVNPSEGDASIDDDSYGTAWCLMARIYFTSDGEFFNPNKGLECLRNAIKYGDVEAIEMAKEAGLL